MTGVTVAFHGVRGSCAGSRTAGSRYGGNTASVAVHALGTDELLLLDAGTGIRTISPPAASPSPITVLASHLHFDHIQGLPFFPPVLDDRFELNVYAPRQNRSSVGEALAALVRPPYFPLRLDELPATIRGHDVERDRFTVGRAAITARPVPHVGATVGYRIEWDGAVLAYISDHQAPPGTTEIVDDVLELCEGADLVIHDAQYTPAELASKPTWGHSTPAYALHVARQAGAKRLCLFHHDPDHSDEELDGMLADVCRECESDGGPEVISAAEGLRITLP